jgi:hypothetical protein
MEDEPSVISTSTFTGCTQDTRVLPPPTRALRRAAASSGGSALELDDLVSARTIGAIEAADRYDPKRGVTFATFAYRRIRGAVIEGDLDVLRRAFA